MLPFEWMIVVLEEGFSKVEEVAQVRLGSFNSGIEINCLIAWPLHHVLGVRQIDFKLKVSYKSRLLN
jgi:hypothetical protein